MVDARGAGGWVGEDRGGERKRRRGKERRGREDQREGGLTVRHSKLRLCPRPAPEARKPTQPHSATLPHRPSTADRSRVLLWLCGGRCAQGIAGREHGRAPCRRAGCADAAPLPVRYAVHVQWCSYKEGGLLRRAKAGVSRPVAPQRASFNCVFNSVSSLSSGEFRA